MKGIAVIAIVALAAGSSACTTTGKRVGAVGGVFGAAVAGRKSFIDSIDPKRTQRE